MASKKNLQELFHDTLKDIYFAEKKILSALPKMAKAAQAQDLRAAFQKHETETEEHVAPLKKVFGEIDEAPHGKTCDAIMGIIEEGQEIMKEFKGAPALDAGRLAAAQAVEHYEIARYGTLKADLVASIAGTPLLPLQRLEEQVPPRHHVIGSNVADAHAHW
jgi:ferritin-like metal-binding protein YciE